MDKPIVSVLMSAYNGERFLDEAIESILEQSFREFEFIIIDDGSTDRSGSILDYYQKGDPRVRAYRQENRGLIESLNNGCQLAQGKYIARMDADDVSVRDRLKWQVEFMEKHSEVAALGGAIEVINLNGESLAIHRYPTGAREISCALRHGSCPLVHPTVLIRKEALVSVGGYRKVMVDAEDYDLWLRMAERYRLTNLQAVVLKYRRHPDQVSVQKFRRQALSNLAARAAAALRRSGKEDPLDLVGRITPELIAALGVDEARQHAAVLRGYLTCIFSMLEAREYSVAHNLMNEAMSTSEWKHAEKPLVADFRLLEARLHWYEKKYTKSAVKIAQAILTRPIMLGRPLKPLLRWIRPIYR